MAISAQRLDDSLKGAVMQGDLARIRGLLSAGAELTRDYTSCQQAHALISAIKNPGDAAELLDLLLRWRFDPNSVYDAIGEEYQRTPFTAAAGAGRVDLMEKLADAGADIHWRSPTGANAASEALPSLSVQDPRPASPSLREARLWLEARGVVPDPDSPDCLRKLCWAASNPFSWPDVAMLLALGVDPSMLKWTPFITKLAEGAATVQDAREVPGDELALTDCYARTPFLLAVAAGRQDLAEILLNHGSDVNAKSWCGATALHLAARYGHLEIIDWLVTLGLAVDLGNDNRDAPLKEAVESGMREAVQKLIQLGADVNLRDWNDYQAIHVTNSQEMIQLLLEAGADVNSISGGGDWPLKDAARHGDVSLVEYLLNRGAIVDLTHTGDTALHAAVAADSMECVSLLLKAGADIKAVDCDDWTCRHWLRSAAMARLLLANGERPSIMDNWGGVPKTPNVFEGTKIYWKNQQRGKNRKQGKRK